MILVGDALLLAVQPVRLLLEGGRELVHALVMGVHGDGLLVGERVQVLHDPPPGWLAGRGGDDGSAAGHAAPGSLALDAVEAGVQVHLGAPSILRANSWSRAGISSGVPAWR